MLKKIAVPLISAAVVLLFLGCSTGESAARLGEAPSGYTALSHGGVALNLSYLDQRDLYKLYGQRNNPFMRYKSGRLIVIEIAVQSDGPLHLDLRNAQLNTPGGSRGLTLKEEVYYYFYSRLIYNYGGYSRHHTPIKSTTMSQTAPDSSFHISAYSYGGRKKEAFHDWSLKITTQIIDESILPLEVDVEEDSETVGYILFEQIRGEKKVDATFTLPVYDQKGELLHEFEFTFPI